MGPTTLLAAKGTGRTYGWLCHAAESSAKHPIRLSSDTTWYQAGKSAALFSGWPQHHMWRNSIRSVSNEATGIHITSAVPRHCRCSQKDLPKLGSCRVGRGPVECGFHNLGPHRSYKKKLPHIPTAQEQYWSPALNKREKKGERGQSIWKIQQKMHF